MKRRRHPKGWAALEEAWRAIDSLPEQKAKYPPLAHVYNSLRNKAIKRYIWTGESEAIDEI